MRKIAFALLGVLLATTAAMADDFDSSRLDNWHHWRGPNANGVAPLANPPIHWDEQTNVKWKVAIPGSGHSTPIVWEDKVFILTAVKTDRKVDVEAAPPAQGRRRRIGRQSAPLDTVFQYIVLCLDRNSGETLWQRVATEEVPHEGHHRDHGYASGSPTTDGRLLYASFGSRGIFCYDLDGNFKWKRDLGHMRTRNAFGEGTSPVLHGDTLIVQWDQEDDSFIVALDAETGETRWKTPRNESTSWSTPIVVEHDGKLQVVANGT